MNWRDIIKTNLSKDEFTQLPEALKEAQKRANETGKIQYIMADTSSPFGEEYMIETEDISSEYPTIILVEKVEPKEKL